MLSCPQSPLLCSSDPQQGPWVVAAAPQALISPFFSQKIQRIQKRKENAALQNRARKPRCCLYLWRAERPCTRCKARQSRAAPSPRGAQEQLDPSPATGTSPSPTTPQQRSGARACWYHWRWCLLRVRPCQQQSSESKCLQHLTGSSRTAAVRRSGGRKATLLLTARRAISNFLFLKKRC